MTTTDSNSYMERLKSIAYVWMAFGVITSALIGMFVSPALGCVYLLLVVLANVTYTHLFSDTRFAKTPTIGIATGLAGIFLVFSGPFAFVVFLLYLRMC